MEKNYFIMMYSQDGSTITPIVKVRGDYDTETMLFKTKLEAKELAEGHDACQAFGYEIFKSGNGE